MSDINLTRAEVIINGAHGQYVAKLFGLTAGGNLAKTFGIPADDIDVLRAGPEHENYWETWDDVLSKAQWTAPNGVKYGLHQDADLFLVPLDDLHEDPEVAASRAKRIEQGVPRYIVDGHEFPNEESNLMADGQYPPFVVFDVDRQENLAGEYLTRASAQVVADAKNAENV